jgi:DNA-binding transcriptional LysR family regulator
LSAGLLDVAVVAYSGAPPAERTTAAARYDLAFYGRGDRFPALADVRDEARLDAFPLVQLEATARQPTLIDSQSGRGTFAIASSLASVKALVLAGFGVGALLDFMLTPAERAELVRAPIEHDPDCHLYVCAGPTWLGPTETALVEQLAERLRAPR